VHGGSENAEPKLITPPLVEELRGLVPLAPEHMPQALAAIEALGQAFPGVPQVVCFDTAFHRTMPRVAQLYSLPHDVQDQGLLRYGFHGLSCESIVLQLAELDEVAGRRVVIAHLGNGASMTAVLDGRSVETTMGFTPAGGLVMATRSGDLDPGVLLYLLCERGLDTVEVAQMVNKRAGMLGVSGTTGDMRRLLALEDSDTRAADAVALFCHQARKLLGGLIAVLGGLDTLVFTGGIGEHAAPVRERICADLGCFGIHLDPARNHEHAPHISTDEGPVRVRVLPTDEEAMIVRHTVNVLRTKGGDHVSV
jgi:acetate kinase